jgi:nucleotide-binding universal stress UspA family protein
MIVLFGTDGSPDATRAINEGIRLLPLKEAQIHVVAVNNPMRTMPMVDIGGMPLPTAVADRIEEAIKVDLDVASAIFKQHDLQVTTAEEVGDPATALMDYAARINADLIVVGSHGGNAFERFFLGSVSDAIGHRWPGAVLIVRPAKEVS